MRPLLALLPLAACATAPSDAPAPAPVFDPLSFFAGRTEGRGTLSVLFRPDRAVRVRGTGRIEPGGALILDQRVEREGRPPATRRWRIRRTGPGTYAGTLSDAAGPVTGRVQGARLHLRFPMKGGFVAEQWLDLAPDGRVADNRMTVSRFGIAVARLRETIRKLD